MKKTMIFFIGVLVIFAASSLILAEDLGTAIVITSSNIPPGADVAGMGNVWVSNPEFSSNNPAAIAASSGYKVNVSGNYGLINFAKGPGINLYSGTITGKMFIGTLQVSYTDGNSNRAANLTGEDFELKNSPSFFIQYGLKIAGSVLKKDDELYLGVNFSRFNSKITTYFETMYGENFTDNYNDGYAFGIGLLYKPVKEFNFGVCYSRSRETVWSGELVSDIYGNLRYENYLHQNANKDLLRIGASLQILPMTRVAVDYQYLRYQNEYSEIVKHQIFAGIEQGIIKDLLYVYGGWAGQGPTAGIGLYLKHGGINLAYMHDPFPEANSSFGQGRLWMATLYFNF